MLQQPRHLPRSGTLSVLSSLIALGYALARFLDLPTRLVETSLFGAEVTFHVSGYTIALLMVAAIIITGCDTLIRVHPRLREDAVGITPAIHCIMPGMAAFVVGMLLRSSPMGLMWLFVLALGVTFLTLLLITEYVVVDPSDGGFRSASLVLKMLSYGTSLILSSWLLGNDQVAVFSAPITVVIFGVIAFRILVLHGASYRQAAINGSAIGLVLGECSWVMGNWTLVPVGAGMLLLTIFHLATGVVQNSLNQGIPRRILLEYGVIGVIAFGLVVKFALLG